MCFTGGFALAMMGDPAVELEGKGHATLTEHRDEDAVRRVLDFLDERLAA